MKDTSAVNLAVPLGNWKLLQIFPEHVQEYNL